MIAWVLGTFHTAVLGIALVLLSYPGGSLGVTLAGLSTITGLALFLALWAITLFATGRATRGLDLLGGVTAGLHRRALRWGAVNGVLFLWAFVAILALQQLATAPGTLQLQTVLIGVGFVGGLGSLVALTFGAVVGLILASIDLAAIGIARAMVRGVRG